MKLNNPVSKTVSACVIVSCVMILASGCGRNDSTELVRSVRVTPLKTLSPQQQAQKQLAIEAKDKLFGALLSELMASMSSKGPAKSIFVCKTRAPEIAAEVSRETGVRIGRTSFKLRNESNTAPEWAAGFVHNKTEAPIEVALPDDELGVLLPIRLKSTCTLCHGTKDQVLPDVKAAIVSSYPQDEATGFSEGDIRGYFWIEVPPQNSAQD